MSSISPDTDGSWGDHCCSVCNNIMESNGTYPPICSKECFDALEEIERENKENEQYITAIKDKE